MGKDGRLTKEELLNRYPPPSEMLDKLFTGLIGALANPAYKYTTGDTPDYRDVLSALTGEEKRDWSDVTKDVFPKIQKKLPENVHLNTKMAGTWGGVLNMLLDPTNLVPGAAMAGEIKNVYHGSPYLLDKFMSSKIGTGEGAAAFGHGHYLTSDKGIAERYAEQLGSKIKRLGNLTEEETASIPSWAQNALVAEQGKININAIDGAIDEFRKRIKAAELNMYASNQPWMQQNQINELNKPVSALEKLKTTKDLTFSKPQYVYEATIAKGRPHNMLQWDKPISEEQWSKIRTQALKDGITDIDKIMGKVFNEPGSYVYYNISDAITRLLNKKAGGEVFRDDSSLASAFLKRAGIDGIEYPSGTLSGIKDSPHKNYVVFDDADITIEKRTPR